MKNHNTSLHVYLRRMPCSLTTIPDTLYPQYRLGFLARTLEAPNLVYDKLQTDSTNSAHELHTPIEHGATSCRVRGHCHINRPLSQEVLCCPIYYPPFRAFPPWTRTSLSLK